SEIVSVGDQTIRVWNRRSGLQVRGTGTGGGPSRRGVLAGVRSDEPSDVDLLDIAEDVDTLATLIAASGTEAPLAIAVLGEWGAGKSTLLQQVRGQVDRLAALSLNNLGRSAYAASIRQITFNAWHYSDDHVWTGLIEHLFRELARNNQTTTPADPAATRNERDHLHGRIRELEADRDRLDATISTVDAAPAPTGRLATVGSPTRLWRAATAAMRTLAGDLRRGYRILAGWAILLAAVGVLWWWLGPWLHTAVTAVAGILAFAPLAVLPRVHGWAVAFTDTEQRRLADDAGRVRRELADSRARLAQVDAAANLADILERTADAATYQDYRGLVGRVSRDLDTLDRALTAARTEWQTSGSTAPPPLERIVLYVDDLDRCPPDRVVEVLTAIHLLLARRLFVVLVAVDAAWLRRSLTAHHSAMFGLPTADTDTTPTATPVDWLDKIFQIPFALRPMGPTATGYLAALLPAAPAGATPPPPPAPPDPATTDSTTSAGPSPPTGSRPPVPTGPVPASPDTPTPPPAPDARLTRPSPIPETDRGRGIPDLRPAALTLTDGERTVIPLVGPLLPTPRAGKKLINLYRLIRIGVPEGELAAFTAGPYQAALLLLTIVIGYPTLAGPLLTALEASTGDTDIVTFLRGSPCGAALQPACDRIADTVATIRQQGTPFHGPLTTYRHWSPRIARHSFHTIGFRQAGAPLTMPRQGGDLPDR
ncbi:P-loop NTPase fold protein, partial [Frankia sp. CiP1_Cm_nod2]|uniref:P-loop NTPase fold protein n=1 Tax=Frankia sp. CiP1_Cm_nod2 TaxID=2897161 RepID=UPI002025B129